MVNRRKHYSTALGQAQGIIEECILLFEYWDDGLNNQEFYNKIKKINLLDVETERRLSNIIKEGFCSRFLREPYIKSAPYIQKLLLNGSSALKRGIVFLYALRQHGIFFDFMIKVYWPSIRSGKGFIDSKDVIKLIDHGRLEGKLDKDWSDSVRKRVSSYVIGIANNFDLLGDSIDNIKTIEFWKPCDRLLLYLLYDLHFLGLNNDEIIKNEEWLVLGVNDEDLNYFLNLFTSRGYINYEKINESVHITWNFKTRDELIDVLL